MKCTWLVLKFDDQGTRYIKENKTNSSLILYADFTTSILNSRTQVEFLPNYTHQNLVKQSKWFTVNVLSFNGSKTQIIECCTPHNNDFICYD